MDRLKTQIDFLVKIEDMKRIYRQSILQDKGDWRRENDAEHSWHICMYALILQEYAPKETDIFKCIKMLLIHDLVEIYAGDTFLYDEKANSDKREREEQAAERLYSILGEQGNELKALWYEFDEGKTLEAQFANACDRLQPILLNYRSKGELWRKNNVHISQVIEKGCWRTRDIDEKVRKFVLDLLGECVEKGYLLP